MELQDLKVGCYYVDLTSKQDRKGRYCIISVNGDRVECWHADFCQDVWLRKSLLSEDIKYLELDTTYYPACRLCPDDHRLTQNVAKTKETKMNTTKVTVHLYSQSQPITIESVVNTYQKGDLFCVSTGGKVCKFPLVHIFRITEEQQ